jgi:hypothetical protein
MTEPEVYILSQRLINEETPIVQPVQEEAVKSTRAEPTPISSDVVR